MRGLLGGMISGGCVSALALAVASLVAEQPAGQTPPVPPLVDAPEVDEAPVVAEAGSQTASDGSDAGAQDPDAIPEATPVSTPVGSLSIDAPQAPELPETSGVLDEDTPPQAPAPALIATEGTAPAADTDPLDEPEVLSIEGSLEAPVAPDSADLVAGPVEPVLPNPQSLAPQTPVSEADLTVSTTPDTPVVVEDDAATVVVEPEGADAEAAEDIFVVAPGEGEGAQTSVIIESESETLNESDEATGGTDAGVAEASEVTADAESTEASDIASTDEIAPATPQTPRTGLQLQGSENSLLTDRGTGVVIRRPATATETEDSAGDVTSEATAGADTGVALVDYAAPFEDVGGRAMMSVVLVDDGSMPGASAALSGLPFPVTIALDAMQADAAEMLSSYRDKGFEVVLQVNLPDGALPSDVEVTFESVFGSFGETIGLLDLGDGGLQSDRDVTEQAMDILAARGAGFVTASQGLNMASRSADQAGVPSAVIYRDLDGDGQDARVIRRFVDQAAFRARQESGVVLVGRMRPDTLSALILWGTANADDQVAIVPLSTILTNQ